MSTILKQFPQPSVSVEYIFSDIIFVGKQLSETVFLQHLVRITRVTRPLDELGKVFL